MTGETYDVLTIPTHVGEVIDKQNLRHKPFVGVYFPIEILQKMGWAKETPLVLSLEKDCLKIVKNDSGFDAFFSNELIYVPVEDE